MSNFSYTASKAWTPYTFEELLKPLAMYTEEYNKQEDALSALDAEAATAGAMADETNDPVTYAKYKSYQEAIQKQADDIARNGLNPSSRKAVLDLRTRYKSDIAPIGEAIKRRRELADEIRKAKLANPTLMVQRDLNSLSPESSLDRFIENPEYNYGDTYSGALLTKQVSDMASHLAKELRGTSTGKLDEYTNTFLKKYGLSSNEVLLAITNPEDPKASKALQAIYNSALESVPQSLREQYAEDINSYINQGFWSAVGQNQISSYENYGNRLAAQEQSYINREIAKKGNLLSDNTQKPYRSIGTTSVDTSKKTTQMKKDIDFLMDMYKNPSKIEEISNRYIPAQISPTTGSIVIPSGTQQIKANVERLNNISRRYGIDLSFQLNTDEKGNTTIDATNKKGINTFEQAVNYLQSEISKSAIRSNSYIVDITDPSLISKNLRENSLSVNRRTNTTGVYELDDNSKGDQVDISNVTEYFNKDVQLEYDPSKGFILTGTNEGNKTKSFLLDPEVIVGETIDWNGTRVNKYQAILEAINQGIENNETDFVQEAIDRLMRDVYARFNSISKRQGLTLSSKEE